MDSKERVTKDQCGHMSAPNTLSLATSLWQIAVRIGAEATKYDQWFSAEVLDFNATGCRDLRDNNFVPRPASH